MKKQNDLQWFLIKKFIEILAVVGVVERTAIFFSGRGRKSALARLRRDLLPVCSFNVTDLRSIECNVSITAS